MVNEYKLNVDAPKLKPVSEYLKLWEDSRSHSMVLQMRFSSE
jgi:hypothetical protein